jgi:oligopeptide/dipeptide ABC transporter ATP-binding protein
VTETLLSMVDVEVSIPTANGDVVPLQGVDLDVRAGETVGLVGESGSGKSMTLRAALRLLPERAAVSRGDVRWRGRSVLRMEAADLRRYRGADVAMIFQDPVAALNPMLTVERQIVDTYLANREGDATAARQAAHAALLGLDIPDPAGVLGRYPHQLSGGMAQRVNIAMALVCEPDLLLADEPTTGLDVTTQLQVLDLLERRVRDEQAALLFISHDLRVVARLCERIGVMYAGRVVEFGTREQITQDPRHPYTRALLSCADLAPGRRPGFIRGQVPSLTIRHELCPFRARCDHVHDACERLPPPRRETTDGHLAACHLEVVPHG